MLLQSYFRQLTASFKFDKIAAKVVSANSYILSGNEYKSTFFLQLTTAKNLLIST